MNAANIAFLSNLWPESFAHKVSRKFAAAKMIKLTENLLQLKNGQVSKKIAAAKNGQVSRKVAAAKNGQVSRKFAAVKNG